MSRVTAIISALVTASSFACHGLLIITAITPLPQSPARQKWQRTEAGELDNYCMQMRQRDVAALDAKYTKELVMRKLKMMLCVMMLPLVVVGAHQSSLSVSA